MITIVDPGIYRGHNLSTEEIRALVGKYSIKTILNLQMFDDFGELVVCEALGVKLLNMDLPSWRLPTIEEMAFIASVMSIESYQPLYVHCRHGRERTGLAVASYRSWKGWPINQAIDEMVRMGCRWPWSWRYAKFLKGVRWI